MNVKEEECRACIGFDEKHTCNGHAMFEFMKAEKYRCQNCKSLQARVDELEAELQATKPEQGSLLGFFSGRL